ncbi:MAG: SusC/RagA family TonB-linked outer membrane protein [Gemmatimonadetes bacterium]|nr:MAG: SusC/RagA family TonB-linked outer membrane protein [Gemmatimonadota bacterium]
MNRVALFLLMLATVLALFPPGAAAQYASSPGASRAPRFLLAMAERSEPVPVDLKRSAVLRQPLSLAFDGVPLKQALAEISRQARLNLVYADDVLPIDATVSLRADRITVAAALTDVLLDAGVDIVFTTDGRATLVKRPEGPAVQLGSIAGTVTAAENSQPLARAIVSVAGTRLTTETDSAGHYVIASVPVGTQRLRARMLGYTPADTTVVVAEGQQAIVNLQLKAQAIELEAVVAVGYGEKTRENVTGAVASIGSEALESRPITNTLTAIQGVIPGVVVERSGGQPGVEDFSLNLRGVSSIPKDPQQLYASSGGNSPLVLIDGIPGNLDLLNPADIETISVLKDAAASIYGARAADGVLLVTTKKGARGAPTFTYSTNAAITKLTGMMDTPNNYQMAIMDNEANIHNGAAPLYTPDLLARVKAGDPNPIPHPIYGSSGWMLFFTSTDWRKAVFEDGFEQKHTLTVSGGGQNSSYYVSAGYSDLNGVIRYANDNNRRYNLRLNYDYDFSRRIRLESKLSLDNQDRSDIGGLSHASWCSCPWLVVEAIFGMPNHPIYTRSGQHFFAQGGWGNAVAQAKEAATATFATRGVNTNFKLIVEPLDGLKLNLQSGINYRTEDNTDIGKSSPLYRWDDSSIAYYSIANPDQNWVTRYNGTTLNRNYVGYAEFSRTFGERHAVELMGGVSHEDHDLDWFQAGRSDFTSQDVWGLNLGSTGNMATGGGGEQWAIRSLFSRLSYGFSNKYLLDATLRYDGSSRFSPDKRWGFFPGVSVAWRVSEEPFARRHLALFDNLKLRASYGENGNQEGIGLYDYLQLITIGRQWPYDPYYPFGAGRQDQSAYLSGMVSTNRTWETIATSNVGVDATLLSSKLDFTFDYFIKNNRDMLVPVAYPSILGAVPPYSNAGRVKTWGFETSLGWKGHVRAVQVSARASLSDAKNKVVNYGGQDTYDLGWNYIREGYPVSSYFGYVFDGLIRTQAELDAYKKIPGVPSDIGIGDARYKDVNGDGKISLYGDTPGKDGDVVYLGNTSPRYTYGLNLDAKWRRLDVSIFMQGVGKRTLFRDGEYRMPWSDWWRQPPLFYYNQTWNEDRPNAPYPRLTHGNIRFWNYQPSTLQATNAAYLRLKNLQIGFSLPERLIARARMTRARVYFSGFDLWEKHNVKGGWDPESPALGFNYPFQRLYSFGMDITF